MLYRYLEDVAIADIAFEASGGSLRELFTAAAEATINVMVEDLRSIRPLQTRYFRFINNDLEMLLFDFLQELIYLKDAEMLLLRIVSIEIKKKDIEYILRATAKGETLKPKIHEQRVDVKAVTLHKFQLKRAAGGWSANIILDV